LFISGVLFCVYAAALGPIIWLMLRAARHINSLPDRHEIYGGLVTSGFIAVLAALLLTSGIGVRGGTLAWLGFVFVCGLVIPAQKTMTVVQYIAVGAIPSLLLLATTLSLYLLPLWLGNSLGQAVSGFGSNGPAPSAPQAISLALFVSLVSIPAITVSSYAREPLIKISQRVLAIRPEQLKQVESSFSIIVRVGAAIAAVFVYMKS
jgi:hypothetical protein